MTTPERMCPTDPNILVQTKVHHTKRYIFSSHFAGNKALDICCGCGYGSEILRSSGKTVVGIDISQEAIDYCEKNYPLNTYVKQDIKHLCPWLIRECDIIIMFEAIEHFNKHEGERLLAKISLNLKDGGLFILSSPRDNNSKYNEYHISEWKPHDIRKITTKLFSDITYLGQDWDTGNISDTRPDENDFFIALCRKKK